ncbi:MAG: MCE family protein [Phycisphaeraceae bacterium]|nr:MCE family protein [Phycisphaeraceae bacterium]
MSLRSPSKYSILAGVFLLGSVALAIAVAFSLTSVLDWLTPANKFTVRFKMTEGAPGIKPDSQVTLGGQKVGTVTTVGFDETTTHVLVGVRVSAAYPIFPNAVLGLERPLLGSQSWINISSVGSGDTKLASGGIIDGKPAGGMLAQFGLSQDDVRKLLDLTQDTISDINQLVEANRSKIDGIFDNVETITKSTREHWPKWVDQFDVTFANVSDFSKQLGPMAGNFNGKVDEFGKLLGNVNTVIDENRSNIQQTTSDAAAIAANVRNKTIPSVDNIVQSVEAWCATELPELRRSVGNLRLATEQAKRAIVEIRAQPWRLFFQPSKKELETDVLFWAANAYADAVSDLRAASEGMQQTLALANAAKPGTGPSEALLQAQFKLLQDSMEIYKKAEQDLLDVLIMQTGNKPSGPAKPAPGAAKPTK